MTLRSGALLFCSPGYPRGCWRQLRAPENCSKPRGRCGLDVCSGSTLPAQLLEQIGSKERAPVTQESRAAAPRHPRCPTLTLRGSLALISTSEATTLPQQAGGRL